MKLFYATTENKRLEIGPTRAGRLMWALERLAIVFPLVFAGFGVLLLPDYIGRYRAAEPTPGLFWASIVLIALFISLLLAVIRFLRHERWSIDARERVLVYERRTFYGQLVSASVELRDLKAVTVAIHRAPRRSMLVAEVAPDHQEIIGHTRVRPSEIAELGEALMAFVKTERLNVEWRCQTDATATPGNDQ